MGEIHFNGPVHVGGDFVLGKVVEVRRGEPRTAAEVVGDYTERDGDEEIYDAEIVDQPEIGDTPEEVRPASLPWIKGEIEQG